MKKTVGTILLLMLIWVSLAASAQDYFTVSELREQAKTGWHKTYTAYGRTIEADLEPVVPQTETAPVFKAEFARIAAPRGDKAYGRQYAILPDTNMYAYWYSAQETPKNPKVSPRAYYVWPRELDKVYPEGEALTLGEAIDVVKDTLETEQFHLDDFSIDYPFEMTTVTDYGRRTLKQIIPGTYRMWFYTLLDGIPVLAHDGQCYKDKTSGWFMPIVDAAVCSEELYNISVEMLQITQRLAEDIPLCSYADILKAIEAEIEAGHIRKVYRLEFGYVLYDDPEYTTGEEWSDGHCYAVPAWMLSCLYMHDPQKELPEYGTRDEGMERNSLEYSSMIINAQTGEMENFMSSDETRALYKGFFTWDQAK